MIPPQFEYAVVSTVPEAIAALQQRPDARVLAGGQSLIPWLKTTYVGPGLLVDIGRIAALRGITVADDVVEIGALTTHREIEDSAELLRVLPLMAEAAGVLADPPVRSRGTFGGSLAYADPGGDWLAVALALDARIHAAGPTKQRVIAIRDLLVDHMQTSLRRDELLTRVTIPIPRRPVGMAYGKLRHPASGYALVGVAVLVQTDDDGVCRTCRVAVTGAGPKAVMADATSHALLGERLTADAVHAAATQASAGLTLSSDPYAGEEYRAHLVRVYVERALLTATSRVGG